jgi:hypothetical protein
VLFVVTDRMEYQFVLAVKYALLMKLSRVIPISAFTVLCKLLSNTMLKG